MDEIHDALRREAEPAEPSRDALERIYGRASRRSRRQRATALAFGLCLTIAVIAGAVALLPADTGGDRPAVAGGVQANLDGSLITSASSAGRVAVVTCTSSCLQADSKGTLTVLDGSTGTVTAQTPVDSPIGVAVTDDSVWVISFSTSTLRQIDPATGTVTRSISLTLTSPPDGLNDQFIPTAIAEGEGRVWVGSDRGQLDRVDPITGQVSTTPLTLKSSAGLAAGNGAVWVGNGVQGVLRIAPDDLSNRRTIVISNGKNRLNVSAVASVDGLVAALGVWTSPTKDGDYVTTGEQALVQINPVTNAVVATRSVPLGSHLHSGSGRIWSVDDAGNVVWVPGPRSDEPLTVSGDLIALTGGRTWTATSDVSSTVVNVS